MTLATNLFIRQIKPNEAGVESNGDHFIWKTSQPMVFFYFLHSASWIERDQLYTSSVPFSATEAPAVSFWSTGPIRKSSWPLTICVHLRLNNILCAVQNSNVLEFLSENFQHNSQVSSKWRKLQFRRFSAHNFSTHHHCCRAVVNVSQHDDLLNDGKWNHKMWCAGIKLPNLFDTDFYRQIDLQPKLHVTARATSGWHSYNCTTLLRTTPVDCGQFDGIFVKWKMEARHINKPESNYNPLKHSVGKMYNSSWHPLKNKNIEMQQIQENETIPILPLDEVKGETDGAYSEEGQFSALSELKGFLIGVLSSLFLAISSAAVNQMHQAVHHWQLNGYHYLVVFIFILPYFCWKQMFPIQQLSTKYGVFWFLFLLTCNCAWSVGNFASVVNISVGVSGSITQIGEMFLAAIAMSIISRKMIGWTRMLSVSLGTVGILWLYQKFIFFTFHGHGWENVAAPDCHTNVTKNDLKFNESCHQLDNASYFDPEQILGVILAVTAALADFGSISTLSYKLQTLKPQV